MMSMRALGWRPVLCGAAMCLLALPALAVGPDDELAFAGTLSFGAGPRWVRSTDFVDNHTTGSFGGAGHVSLPFTDFLSAQLDIQSEMYTEDGDFSPQGAHMAGIHLSLRDPEIGLIGAFAGGGLPTIEAAQANRIGYLMGGDGQVYLGPFTVYMQAGWAHFKVDNEPEGFVKGWFIKGVSRFFPTDDSVIEAGLSYGATDQFIDGRGDNDKGQIWNWSAKGKYRIMKKYPVYGTVEYLGANYDATTENDWGKEHAVIFGFNFVFGAESLKHNDRYGATLDQPMLPVRAASWAEALD